MLLLFIVMLNFFMLNVIMLNVVMLNVVMLNVIMLNVIMLNVIMLNVIMLNVIMLTVVGLIAGWRWKYWLCAFWSKYLSLTQYPLTERHFAETIFVRHSCQALSIQRVSQINAFRQKVFCQKARSRDIYDHSRAIAKCKFHIFFENS